MCSLSYHLVATAAFDAKANSLGQTSCNDMYAAECPLGISEAAWPWDTMTSLAQILSSFKSLRTVHC